MGVLPHERILLHASSLPHKKAYHTSSIVVPNPGVLPQSRTWIDGVSRAAKPSQCDGGRRPTPLTPTHLAAAVTLTGGGAAGLFRLPSGERFVWCSSRLQWLGYGGGTPWTGQADVGQDLIGAPLVIDCRHDGGAPFRTPALQGAEVNRRILIRIVLLEFPKDRFGRTRRIGLQPVFNLRLHLGKGIRTASPPAWNLCVRAPIHPLVLPDLRWIRCGRMVGQAAISGDK